jgi:hypothetical protein
MALRGGDRVAISAGTGGTVGGEKDESMGRGKKREARGDVLVRKGIKTKSPKLR